MFSIIRRSQIIGLAVINSSTVSRLGSIEEIWLDESGRIAYLSEGGGEYLPLEQVAGVGAGAVSVYHPIRRETPTHLHRLHQFVVQSTIGESLGWVEDFLFDWQTGEVVAYILTGEIAKPFGGRAVLYPEDVETIEAETIVIPEKTKGRLKSESEGLRGFLSEKSQQVKDLVHRMGDRLHDLISPQDKPDVVRVKIKAVSDELAASGEHDHHALQEATTFIHDQWESLQQSLSHTGQRAKVALESTWKQLTGEKT
jgi:uncharacterized protein YrrD